MAPGASGGGIVAKTVAISGSGGHAPVAATAFGSFTVGSLTCTRGLLNGQRFSLSAQGLLIGRQPGLAQIAKLANNLLAAAAIVLSSEALAMGVKAGLDAQTLCDIINAGSGRNSATQDKFPKSVIPRTFDFGFATGLSYKDVRLCLDEAEALGVPMVAGAAVRQMLAITNAKFGPESDFTSIARVVEEWAGIEIK
jgi:3-hydroxyisobutyrate dehydrogenase-like beta-hydroxyacid dehydrogenase